MIQRPHEIRKTSHVLILSLALFALTIVRLQISKREDDRRILLFHSGSRLGAQALRPQRTWRRLENIRFAGTIWGSLGNVDRRGGCLHLAAMLGYQDGGRDVHAMYGGADGVDGGLGGGIETATGV
jgi:hypothetical protein